jgi:hypothetical protein
MNKEERGYALGFQVLALDEGRVEKGSLDIVRGEVGVGVPVLEAGKETSVRVVPLEEGRFSLGKKGRLPFPDGGDEQTLLLLLGDALLDLSKKRFVPGGKGRKRLPARYGRVLPLLCVSTPVKEDWVRLESARGAEKESFSLLLDQGRRALLARGGREVQINILRLSLLPNHVLLLFSPSPRKRSSFLDFPSFRRLDCDSLLL